MVSIVNHTNFLVDLDASNEDRQQSIDIFEP